MTVRKWHFAIIGGLLLIGGFMSQDGVSEPWVSIGAFLAIGSMLVGAAFGATLFGVKVPWLRKPE